MLVGFSAVQSVVLAQGTSVVVVASATQPADTTTMWLQLDSLGRPVRIYYFAQGAWLSKHPLEPGMTMIWTTTLPTFTTFDGGDADPLSNISGPMWELVTAFATRVPIGVGTLPSGQVIAVGATGGSEEITLDSTNMPQHQHYAFRGADAGGAAVNVNATTYAARTFDDGNDNVERYRIKGLATESDTGLTSFIGGDGAGDAVAHNNMPPWLGVFLIRRTARTHYAV
jgi:microcystin-dependent protein